MKVETNAIKVLGALMFAASFFLSLVRGTFDLGSGPIVFVGGLLCFVLTTLLQIRETLWRMEARGTNEPTKT